MRRMTHFLSLSLAAEKTRRTQEELLHFVREGRLHLFIHVNQRTEVWIWHPGKQEKSVVQLEDRPDFLQLSDPDAVDLAASGSVSVEFCPVAYKDSDRVEAAQGGIRLDPRTSEGSRADRAITTSFSSIDREHLEWGVVERRRGELQTVSVSRDAVHVRRSELWNALDDGQESMAYVQKKVKATEQLFAATKLATLNEAARKFWTESRIDPDTPSTFPTNEEVAEWLVYKGYSRSLAQAGATIIRPNFTPEGGRPAEVDPGYVASKTPKIPG